MKSHIIVALFVVALFSGCATKVNLQSVTPEYYPNVEEVKVEPGADRDEHGCLGSAGYTWSKVKNDCIRLFEAGVKLLPEDPDASLAAYVVFNADSSVAEVFFAGGSQLLNLRSGTKNIWTSADEKLVLSRAAAGLALASGDKIIYREKNK